MLASRIEAGCGKGAGASLVQEEECGFHAVGRFFWHENGCVLEWLI